MSSVEWDGVGLPPVGAKVITNYEHSCYESAQQAHNKEAVIVAHANNVAIFEYYHNGCKFYHGFYSGYFKPSKSERDKAIEEIGEKILGIELIFLTGNHAKLVATAIYDAGYRKVEK